MMPKTVKRFADDIMLWLWAVPPDGDCLPPSQEPRSGSHPEWSSVNLGVSHQGCRGYDL